jgi:hypothetical protein
VLLLPGWNNVIGTGHERATMTRRILAIVSLLGQIVPFMLPQNSAFAYNFFGLMTHLE